MVKKAPVQNDIERAIEALSANTSLFPPGRQRLSELSSELEIDFGVLQQIVAHLSIGLLKFVEPPVVKKPEPLVKPTVAKSEEKIKNV